MLHERAKPDSSRKAMKHCDDYIDDPTQPECLRRYLAHARSPAHGTLNPKPHPRLFAFHDGEPVRVVMASRLGDVGITTDLHASNGYEKRVSVDSLSGFSAERPSDAA